MLDLKGKKALVTGASGGIGQAIATALHAQGAQVALSGTRVDVLDAAAARLGEGSHAIPANLSDRDSPARLVGEASEAMGGLDILVNNAGITRDNIALRLKDEDWEAVMRLNLGAAFRLSRAALRGMMKARWGRIINITSIVGVTGSAGQANYAAAKAGLIGLTKSVAKELAKRGVTCNAVAPGFIETDMTAEVPAKVLEQVCSATPIGRLGKPEEVAAAVVFLASPAASFVTGAMLDVNGGMRM